MLKRLLFLMLSSIIFMNTSIYSFASDLEYKDNNTSIEEKYNITEDEIINLENNLKNALNKLNSKRTINEINSEGIIEETIQVSENLILTITTEEEINTNNTRAITNKTITSTLKLKNIFGVTLIQLNSVGTFKIDGSISNPIDAYGSYNAYFWNVSNTTSTKGTATYNSWVRNSFSGKLDLGIDPISITVQTFSNSCTIYCNANGTYSATWS